ncbi:hypothetical protein GGTG_05463 [Gaeumannomyces tritici R3-111a-1]|uniref:Uncharacterized protein n=1 Tax=Gaeumannomyces tritici (strain R3-111a-1) TaxID=644352 RepID=J3NW00_GAET3|nr:hypothetical protein GGTG_05463 [Gaeumannomyces tritici R3-111a-1]EJT75530.1 hypothetical protein GGTG_05463 [Gaeumannomyces tritici R3-111a-1]
MRKQSYAVCVCVCVWWWWWLLLPAYQPRMPKRKGKTRGCDGCVLGHQSIGSNPPPAMRVVVRRPSRIIIMVLLVRRLSAEEPAVLNRAHLSKHPLFWLLLSKVGAARCGCIPSSLLMISSSSQLLCTRGVSHTIGQAALLRPGPSKKSKQRNKATWRPKPDR